MQGREPATADRSPRAAGRDQLRLCPLLFRPHPSAFIIVLALPCLLLAGVPDTVNTEALPPPVHPGIAAGEMVGAAAFGAGLGLAGGLAGTFLGVAVDPPEDEPILADSPGQVIGALSGLAAGASFGAASGAWLVGKAFDQHGRFLPTWGWAAVVAASGVLLLDLAMLVGNPGENESAYNDLMMWGGSTLLVGTPVIAAWAYNRSRVTTSAEADSRLSFGRVAMRPIAGPDRGLHTCVDLCLVNVGF
ncbi:MAG: hypothetical protein JSU73_11915 [candidate division WOR-3 bacterium]|nr:MAG: hypothetical protein JSU73_11915 [candidate division WOR-3 bacterium]